MILIRKHKYQLCMSVLIVCGFLAAFQYPSRIDATARANTSDQTPHQELDPDAYHALQSVRLRLCLTDRDLAAMGCTQDNAVAILTELRNWYDDKRDDLEALEAKERGARSALSRAMRQVNRGPRDNALLHEIPSLVHASNEAAVSYQNALDNAAHRVGLLLTNAQMQTWSLARTNSAAPLRYRYMALNPEQLATLSAALAKAGRDAEHVADYERRTLTGSQQYALALSVARLAQYMDGVRRAADSVIPPPEELIPPDLNDITE